MTIAQYAYAAGWRGDDLRTAIAVAYAESGGNPLAYNPETAAGTPSGKGSVGLWQVYRKAHPEFASWDLTDPATNARAAYSVWKQAGQSFRPWSTFQNSSQVKYLPTADAEIAALTTSGTNWQAVASIAGAIGAGLLGAWAFKHFGHKL
jgi:hypothetical protein